jgi:hypothetical protein
MSNLHDDPDQMARYIRLPTDAAAAYVTKTLTYGHTLSRLVLEAVDLSTGMLISTLPAVVGVEAASVHFGGGKLPQPQPRHRGYHVFTSGTRTPILDSLAAPAQTIISDWLATQTQGLCVLEDIFGHVRNPRIKVRSACGVLTFGAESYYTLWHEDVDDVDKVSRCIDQNVSDPTWFAVLTTGDPRLRDMDGSEITEDTIRSMGRGGGGHHRWRVPRRRPGGVGTDQRRSMAELPRR